MIAENIKWSFNQLETALIAFAGNIELKLQQIAGNLPVYVLQTGDYSYLIDKKFKQIPQNEIYEKTPRLTLTIEDIQPLNDQDSNQYNRLAYIFENENYTTVFRRKAINIPMMTDFVSPNFIKALENFEVMATITSKENSFTYEYQGMTLQAAYVFTSGSQEKPTMDANSSTRNITIKTGFDLQIQLLVPKIDSIKLLSESGFNEIDFELTANNNIIPHTEDIKFLIDED